ncbi:MAG TPA: hypothetical protein VMM81_03390 [Acidimicrobiia bacterium]|nr:hypothetical protein [Acidimicrobiia bacterium]
MRDRLPDLVARHWGISGAADGFSTLNATLAVTVGMVLLVAVPMGLAAVLARQPPAMRRFMQERRRGCRSSSWSWSSTRCAASST